MYNSVDVAEFQLVASAAGTDSDTYANANGRVVRVELYSADTVLDSATIKGYETNALPAVGSRHDFLAYTKSGGGTLSTEILPTIQRTSTAGVAVTDEYEPPIVAGEITVAIAGFTENTGVRVRVYIEGGGG